MIVEISVRDQKFVYDDANRVAHVTMNEVDFLKVERMFPNPPMYFEPGAKIDIFRSEEDWLRLT